jgi:HAD superfamily hydrolase (TIGR01490 family)
LRKVAIYDLDGTVLRRASFTPFLLFAARRHAGWKVCLAPVWFAAMALYKLGFFSRRALKEFGLRLFLGRRMDAVRLQSISQAFADRVVPAWLAPGAMQAMADDRAEGRSLILATAAMEFYAAEIGRRLGFDHVVASRARPLSAGPATCMIEGENCYGTQKPARVQALFDELGWNRSDCIIRFYTDSASDAPLLDWADQPVLVNGGPRARRTAQARGWAQARFY